jgi:protein-tyrosine phosphatase
MATRQSKAAQADESRRSNFDVAVICTGNQFRSPLVAALLRSLGGSLPVRVASLGTADLGPARALPEAIEIGSRLGVDLTQHRARCMAKFNLSGADLVIGFEAMHVASAVIDAGARPEVTFTLPEIVDLLERTPHVEEPDPAERARRAVAEAHAARRGRGLPPVEFEIPDPLGGTPQQFEAMATQLRGLTARLLKLLF